MACKNVNEDFYVLSICILVFRIKKSKTVAGNTILRNVDDVSHVITVRHPRRKFDVNRAVHRNVILRPQGRAS